MVYTIAQVSDIHIGGHTPGSGERFSAAIAEVNTMTRQPDLVLLTGDLTHNGSPDEWNELLARLEPLDAPWEAIAGNHDRNIAEIAGHRSIAAGPNRLILVDSSNDSFGSNDANWLNQELVANPDSSTVIAIHHPPFETGIWWMDCVGLEGKELFEEVVRRHPQVIQVLSGHVHRAIHTSWGGCSLWVCPSTSVTVAGDLDPEHDPAETAEEPMFSLHAYTGSGVVSHLVPVGPAAERNLIGEHAPDFITFARGVQTSRSSVFR